MKRSILIFLLIVFTTPFFSQSNVVNYKKIEVASGPEDFVIDTTGASYPRLIVACQERRDKKQWGNYGFYEVNLTNYAVKKLVRVYEPDSFYLWLHGMDIEFFNNKTYIYAISHPEEGDMIVKYELKGDSLKFIRTYKGFPIQKINDVSVYQGNLIVSNAQYRKGNIAYIDSTGKGQILVNNVHYANGVYFENEYVIYYSSSLEHSLVRVVLDTHFKVLSEKKIAKVKVADNIMRDGDNLYVTSHPKLIKFIKHYKNSEKKSPSEIYCYNLKDKKISSIYYSDGTIISASSSACSFRKKLYVSQVFENYIIEIDVYDNKF